MLHKVTAEGRIIHMEDKEIIGILDGLISKRVNESEIIEYKTNLFDKEMFGKYNLHCQIQQHFWMKKERIFFGELKMALLT